MSEKPAAALPKEEAPRCPTCARCGRQKADPAFSVFPHIYELEHCLAEIPCAQSTYLEIKCYRLGYERSTAAHQKTLDALAEMIGTPRMGTGLVFQARLMAKSAIAYAANKEPADNLYVNAKDTLAEADRLYAIGQAALRAGGRNV